MTTSTSPSPSATLDAPRGDARPAGRRRRRLLIALGAVAVLAVATVLTAVVVDRHGTAFFLTGRDAVVTLDALAAALADGDAGALAALHAADFRGTALGLDRRSLVSDKDGLRLYRLGPEGTAPATDRAAAVTAWSAYRAGFASVDEARFHLHRIEQWDGGGPLTASVRFEVLGTPRGAPRSAIDRGLLRMRFQPAPPGGGSDPGPGAAPAFVVASAELLEGDRQIADRPQFTDVGPELGIDFENRYYPPFLEEDLAFEMLRFGPAGITAADVDADGFYDLFVPDGVESRFYRNNGDGTFSDRTAAAGLAGLSGVSVALFADFDDDGHRDLFVSRTFEPNQIFRNRGDGTFEDVTAATGIGADCCTTVASVADVDLDGDLDLYVGRYLDPRLDVPTTFYARNGEPNQLYLNDGTDGTGFPTFTNVTEEAGVGELGLCLGTVFGDYDDDGDPDLYVVNDFGRKTLYRNDGTNGTGVPTFTDVTVDSGTLAYGAGMSASFGDYDNDQRLDLYVAHIRSEHAWFAEAPTVWRYMLNTWRQGVWMTDMPLYFEIFRQSGFSFVDVFQQMASGNTLLRNRGDGTFEDVTWETAANPPGWFWGSGFYDVDNDGWQDIYSANGWVYAEEGTEIELEFLNNVVSEQARYKTGEFFDPDNFGGHSWHGHERNRHLRNEGGHFVEIGHAAGTDLLLNSRGIAAADFWNRGVLDLAVAASTDRHALLRNEVGHARPFLALELTGAGADLPRGSNRDAVGARVTLTAGGLTQVREVVLGDGYGSQNALRLHFGLGDVPVVDGAPVVDEIVVRWPASGRVQTFTGVAANRILHLTEGAEELEERVAVAR